MQRLDAKLKHDHSIIGFGYFGLNFLFWFLVLSEVRVVEMIYNDLNDVQEKDEFYAVDYII